MKCPRLSLVGVEHKGLRLKASPSRRVGIMRKLLCVLVAVLVPDPASATLTEVDLFASGDALVTRDSVTGLDWLDLPLTLGLSHNEIVLDGAGGWAGDGWQHATCDQVTGLFAAAGMALLACPNGQETGGDNTPRDFLLDLIGRTAGSQLPNTALGIYEIGSDDLAIQCLFSRIRIPLNEIVSVRRTRNPRSSPALSLDRLAIERSKGRSVRISPKRRDHFLTELALRAGLRREGAGLRR